MANNETYTCSPSEVCLSDSITSSHDSEFLIPTPWSDESKNEKREKRWREEFEWKRSLFEIDFTFGINAFDLDKRTNVMKDTVSQKNECEEEVPLNNNIGKQIGNFVDMPSEAVEQRMDANVPNDIDGAKGEQVLNHVVKKGIQHLEEIHRLEMVSQDTRDAVTIQSMTTSEIWRWRHNVADLKKP
ncbi:hypothetical protein Tco_1571873 [Tanacetum coccineum]